MKRPHLLSRVFPALLLSSALSLNAFAFEPGLPVSPSLPSPPAATPAESASPVVPVFSGRALCLAVLSNLHRLHIELAEPARRNIWIDEWRPRCDQEELVGSEDSADQLMRRMVASLGGRFDRFADRRQTAVERERSSATMTGGIGISYGLRLTPAERRQLGASGNATPEQAPAPTQISQEHPVVILDVFEGGPAAQGGMRVGDRILSVDSQSVEGMVLNDLSTLIRGQIGTPVTFTLERRREDGTLTTVDVVVVRGLVRIPAVRSRTLAGDIAHIRLTTFSRRSSLELLEALESAAGRRAVILDLRDNPGGLLDEVLPMLPMFMETGVAITTRTRAADTLAEEMNLITPEIVLGFTADGNVQLLGPRNRQVIPVGMPVIVLVNGNSASASEILAGALQRLRNVVVAGTPSFGKGVGQSVVPLPFGRQVVITSFEFLPGGVAINDVGVIPDIEVRDDEDTEADEQLEAAVREALSRIAVREDFEARRSARQRARGPASP